MGGSSWLALRTIAMRTLQCKGPQCCCLYARQRTEACEDVVDASPCCVCARQCARGSLKNAACVPDNLHDSGLQYPAQLFAELHLLFQILLAMPQHQGFLAPQLHCLGRVTTMQHNSMYSIVAAHEELPLLARACAL